MAKSGALLLADKGGRMSPVQVREIVKENSQGFAR